MNIEPGSIVINAVTVRRMLAWVDTIDGYGHFREGQDGKAALDALRGTLKKAEMLAEPESGPELAQLATKLKTRIESQLGSLKDVALHGVFKCTAIGLGLVAEFYQPGSLKPKDD